MNNINQSSPSVAGANPMIAPFRGCMPENEWGLILEGRKLDFLYAMRSRMPGLADSIYSDTYDSVKSAVMLTLGYKRTEWGWIKPQRSE